MARPSVKRAGLALAGISAGAVFTALAVGSFHATNASRESNPAGSGHLARSGAARPGMEAPRSDVRAAAPNRPSPEHPGRFDGLTDDQRAILQSLLDEGHDPEAIEVDRGGDGGFATFITWPGSPERSRRANPLAADRDAALRALENSDAVTRRAAVRQLVRWLARNAGDGAVADALGRLASREAEPMSAAMAAAAVLRANSNSGFGSLLESLQYQPYLAVRQNLIAQSAKLFSRRMERRVNNSVALASRREILRRTLERIAAGDGFVPAARLARDILAGRPASVWTPGELDDEATRQMYIESEKTRTAALNPSPR